MRLDHLLSMENRISTNGVRDEIIFGNSTGRKSRKLDERPTGELREALQAKRVLRDLVVQLSVIGRDESHRSLKQ